MANASSMVDPTNCEVNLLWPATALCDAAGACLVDGRCLCDKGWSGSGDFTSLGRSDIACDINEAAVTILWAVMGTFHVAATLFSMHATQFEVRAMLRGKTLSGWTQMIVATRLVTLVAFASSSALLSTVALLKVASPLENRRIGNDTLTTALFSAAATLYWIGASTKSAFFFLCDRFCSSFSSRVCSFCGYSPITYHFLV